MSRDRSAVAIELRFVCHHCGDPLDVELDGEWVEYGRRHECWGDKANSIAIIEDGGIQVMDDRVNIEVEHAAE